VGCPACTSPSPGTSHEGVPCRTQYASPDLIEAIAYTGLDPADDPSWPQTGAHDQAEYGRWCRHCCGMACLQMILEHRDGTAPPLLELLRAGLPYGTYRTEPDDTIHGLYYHPFAHYTRDVHHLDATVHPHLDLDLVFDQLAAGRIVLASVHKEIRRPEHPSPGRGGHLVLVTGHHPDSGTVFFRNPSGHTPAAREANLPAAVFGAFFGGRGISVAVT
jgi:hypothetical protein